MPFYTQDASGTTYAQNKLIQQDASGASYDCGSMYDQDAAGVLREVWRSEQSVTLTNYGIAPRIAWSWGDAGYDTDTLNLANNKGNARVWVYAKLSGWGHVAGDGAYADANVKYGNINQLPRWSVLGDQGQTPVKSIDRLYTDPGTYNLRLEMWRYNSSQGAITVVDQVMCVPLAPIESALGRQISLAEARSLIGYGWGGSKTITLQT